MNSVPNGKVLHRTPYKRLYVQAAAGDAGGALGAAIYAWHRVSDPKLKPAREVSPRALAGDTLESQTIMEHAYLGPVGRHEEIAALLATHTADLEGAGCRVERIEDEDALCRRTAEAIASGGVGDWFIYRQGSSC